MFNTVIANVQRCYSQCATLLDPMCNASIAHVQLYYSQCAALLEPMCNTVIANVQRAGRNAQSAYM